MDNTIENTAPDPNDPNAVEIAEELVARGQVFRLVPGEVIQVGGWRRQPHAYKGLAVSIHSITSEEREWFVTYQAAAKRKRREDREAVRRARRGLPPV